MLPLKDLIKNTSLTKNKNFLSIAFTLILLVSIPLTVFVSLNIRDNRGRAAEGPVVLYEENFKKLKLKYTPSTNTLVILETIEDDTLPEPPADKQSNKDNKVFSFQIEQTNEFIKPIYNYEQDVLAKVDSSGKSVESDIFFSVQVFDKPGKIMISLANKKLLETTIK